MNKTNKGSLDENKQTSKRDMTIVSIYKDDLNIRTRKKD